MEIMVLMEVQEILVSLASQDSLASQGLLELLDLLETKDLLDHQVFRETQVVVSQVTPELKVMLVSLVLKALQDQDYPVSTAQMSVTTGVSPQSLTASTVCAERATDLDRTHTLAPVMMCSAATRTKDFIAGVNLTLANL